MAEDFSADGMLDMYLYENGQLLEQLEATTLEKKDADSFDEADINEFFRVMHTIKGSSGIMMFDDIMKLAHKLEDVFYFIRESKPDNVPHMELVEHIFQVSDFISAEFDKIRDGGDPDGDAKELIDELDVFLKKIKNEATEDGKELPPANVQEPPKQFYIAPVATENSKFYRIHIFYRADTQMSNLRAYTAVYSLKEIAEDILYKPEDIVTNEASADVILADGFQMMLQTQSSKEKIEKLIDGSGVEKIDITECTPDEYIKGFEAPVIVNNGKVIDLDSDVETIEARVQKEQEAKKSEEPKPGDYVIKTKEPGKPKQLAKTRKEKPAAQTFISVNVAKMDMLMDLIGEIVIAESVVLQNPDLKVPGLSLNNFNKAAAQLTKFTSELQGVIMSMRMMPLTNTFQKMNRIVFDASRKVGKNIELKMIGETTEVDKNIIEHISDPLMHMIRNSVDHGIEEKEERAAAGKPEKGVITLEAKNEGGKVFLSVSDDGKGMDPDKLFAKAKRAADPAGKNAERLYAKGDLSVCYISGIFNERKGYRVIRQRCRHGRCCEKYPSVGGQLDIDSELGKGTTMTLKIPLTLAIIEGIVMRVGESIFVIESGSIKEFLNVKESDMVYEPGGEEYVMIRGECFPVVRLSRKYHLEHAKEEVSDGIMILVEHEDKKCAFSWII